MRKNAIILWKGYYSVLYCRNYLFILYVSVSRGGGEWYYCKIIFVIAKIKFLLLCYFSEYFILESDKSHYPYYSPLLSKMEKNFPI